MGEFNFAEELKKMPQTPGVYLMHDAHDDVIYVGKAVNLKRRVSSYFRKSTNIIQCLWMTKHILM